MGCDIHLHTEIKVNGKWLHYGAPSVPRCYALFALMADVRNSDGDIIPVSKPKGLPDDISEITRLSNQRWGCDGHSHSWLSAVELAKLEDAWQKHKPHGWDQSDLEHHYFGYLESNSWAGFAKYPEDREPWIEDVRFVFWFDN
jgi:hypothetical protein